MLMKLETTSVSS